MKKYIVTWDFLFIIIACFFGGILDGFTFLFRDGTFCLAQTGNLVKCISFYVLGKNFEATYALLVILFFCLFILVFYFIFKYLKIKEINYHFFSLPLMGVLLVPAIIWEFNTINYLSYQNLISGCALSMIGSIFAISFKNIRFKSDKKITFNAAVMTGNMRDLMLCLGEFIKNKDKEKGFQSFCYLVIISCFVFGVGISGICFIYIKSSWNLYSIFLILYLLIMIMIWVFHYRYQWIKNNKNQKNNID